MTTHQKISITILMICAFLIAGELYVTLPIVSGIAETYAVAATTATLVGSAFGLAYAAGFLISGPLSDRFGRVGVIFYGMLATAGASLFVAFAPSFSWLVIFRVFQGFCAASFPPAALSLVTEILPTNRKTLGISLISLAFLSAAPLAQYIGELQADIGITGIMFEVTPLYLVFAVIFRLVFQKDSEAQKGFAREQDISSNTVANLFSDKGIIFTWLAAATVLYGFVSFHSSLQAFNQNLNLDLQLVRICGFPTLLLTLFACRTTNRYGGPVTAMIGLFLGMVAFGFSVFGNVTLILMASAVLSAGIAFALPGLIATVASRTNIRNRGFAMAVYSFTLFLGASVASPIVTSLQYLGINTLSAIPAALLLAGILGLQFARKPILLK